MKTRLFAVLILVAASIQSAFADSWPRARITNIVMDEVSGANGPVLRIVNVDNPAWNIWLTLNSAYADKYLAVALSAMSMGKDIEIQFQVNSAYGYNGQLKWLSLAN
jgi:hypothetical protein